MSDSIYKVRQRRWKCPHCKQCGWETGRENTSPLFDHDRADGKKCRVAEREPDKR